MFALYDCSIDIKIIKQLLQIIEANPPRLHNLLVGKQHINLSYAKVCVNIQNALQKNTHLRHVDLRVISREVVKDPNFGSILSPRSFWSPRAPLLPIRQSMLHFWVILLCMKRCKHELPEDMRLHMLSNFFLMEPYETSDA